MLIDRKVWFTGLNSCGTCALLMTNKWMLTFRLSIPELLSRVSICVVMSTLPEVHAARSQAERFRCKACDHVCTSGNHATICRWVVRSGLDSLTRHRGVKLPKERFVLRPLVNPYYMRLTEEISILNTSINFVTSHYPQVAAAWIKSSSGWMLFVPISLSLR